ncbi:MAG: riboflavin synthase [Francisellaceae bacterium]
MFSGIVQEIGKIKLRHFSDEILTLEIAFDSAAQCRIGDSVAVNGVCLTVVAISDEKQARFEVVAETLRKTTLATLSQADEVNIELALRYGDPVGGHLVSGHIDGVAEIETIQKEGGALLVRFGADKSWLNYMVDKGFITIDGMSITLIEVLEDSFTVSFIPQTITATIVKNYKPDTKVNIEIDAMGKQIYKYLDHLNIYSQAGVK